MFITQKLIILINWNFVGMIVGTEDLKYDDNIWFYNKEITLVRFWFVDII